MAMTQKQAEVLRSIIYHVESGTKYDCLIGAGTGSDIEQAITIGAGQWYGVEAKNLLNRIRKANPSEFKKLDTQNIASDLDTKNWSCYDLDPKGAKATCIKKIISTTTGKKCQDEYIVEQLNAFMAEALALGVTDVKGQAMCANFRHHGGASAVKRIIAKTKKPYTLDNLYAACCTDTGNQVGAPKYRSRQVYVYSHLKSDFPVDESTDNTTSAGKTDNIGGTPMISNCGHDENNKYSGGKAGDQTGTEWAIIKWYNRPWDCVLRHPDPKVREKIAELAEKAAKNDLIGYDQNERTTFWYHLKASGYDPSKITIACESDCSSGVAAIVRATGILLNNAELAAVDINLWTSIMKNALKAAGFEVITRTNERTNPDYLCRGDILLNESHHVATNLTTGSKCTVNNTGASTGNNNNSNSGSSPSRTVKWTGTVSADTVPRSWAGEDYSALKSISVVKKNTSVGVCDTVKANDKKDWYFCKIGSVYGFLPASVVKKAGTTTATSNGKLNTTPVAHGTVTASVLEVRSWAGTEYNNIKSWPQLSYGNEVDICDTVKDSKGANWYYVKIANKYYGFVHSAYVKKTAL